MSALALGLPTSDRRAKAAWVPQPRPLEQSLALADAIVTARITDRQDDPSKLPKLNTVTMPDGRSAYVGADAAFVASLFQLPGRYSLQVEETLKGQTKSSLTLDLPALLSYSYGRAQFKTEVGSRVLLALLKDVKGEWKPADDLLPLIPLAADANTITSSSWQEKVNTLLLSSMSDSALRPVHSHLLREAVEPRIVVGLAPYINDLNPQVRDNVMHAMAVNQQVSIIPRIAEMEQKLAMGGSLAAVRALGLFHAPEAVPHLNPLLLAQSKYLRISAMPLLNRQRHRSSIPYFLLTSYDPSPAGGLGHTAYGVLRKMILPSLPFLVPTQFYARQDDARRPFIDWWRDELAGKHPKAPDEPPSPTIDFERLPQNAAPILNALLFEKKLKLRQDAANALQKHADRTSIPYLLLALHDPDGDVSFLAYRILHRLIDTLPPPTARSLFEAKRESYTSELFNWWRDELLGKHFAPDPILAPRVAPPVAAPVAAPVAPSVAR